MNHTVCTNLIDYFNQLECGKEVWFTKFHIHISLFHGKSISRGYFSVMSQTTFLFSNLILERCISKQKYFKINLLTYTLKEWRVLGDARECLDLFRKLFCYKWRPWYVVDRKGSTVLDCTLIYFPSSSVDLGKIQLGSSRDVPNTIIADIDLSEISLCFLSSAANTDQSLDVQAVVRP